jgi:hypothetical protein
MVAAQAAGRRIETADAWIAVTALLYDAPLVTHNGSDYLGVPGLKLISHGSWPGPPFVSPRADAAEFIPVTMLAGVRS